MNQYFRQAIRTNELFRTASLATEHEDLSQVEAEFNAPLFLEETTMRLTPKNGLSEEEAREEEADRIYEESGPAIWADSPDEYDKFVFYIEMLAMNINLGNLASARDNIKEVLRFLTNARERYVEKKLNEKYS